MASKVDVCNLALGHLGAQPTVVSIDPADGGANAIHCSRFFPLALNYLLTSHPWQFALRRVALVNVDDSPNDQWAYSKALPAGCLRPHALLPPGAAADTDGVPYVIEGSVLYCDVDEPVLLYITSEFSFASAPASFVMALSWRLAYMLSSAVSKADIGTRRFLDEMAKAEMSKAATVDAMSRKQKTIEHIPVWMRSR